MTLSQEVLVEAFKASNALLIATTQILGEIESTGTGGLPYRLKDLKIKIDLQIMANANARKDAGS